MGMSLLFPGILIAGAAAVAPVVIHLILRTRPRRVVFPAMQFVRKTHEANLSRLKLKHLILLALRILAILLIVLLIARPTIERWRSSWAPSAPSAAVFVVDDSGSMGYRYHGQSRLAGGKQLAAAVLQSLPAGSRFAVIPTSRPAAPAGFLTDRQLVIRQISGIEQGPGDQSIAAALRQAIRMLRQERMGRKEVYVVTDMTYRAWRDVASAADDETDEGAVDIIVLNCGGGQGVNAALGDLRLSSSAAPLRSVVQIEVPVTSVRATGEMIVQAELDGRVVGRETVSLSDDGGRASVSFLLRPRRPGVLGGRIVLRHRDGLALDNVRYFTIVVAPAREVWIVQGSPGAGGSVGFLMASAIAPGGAASAGRSWVHRRVVSARQLLRQELTSGGVVLLAGAGWLDRRAWGRLERFVRAGGGLWVVAGPGTCPPSYNADAAQLMPVALGPLQRLAKPTGWLVGEATHPILEPFSRGRNPPLSQVRHLRRFGVESVASQAVVVLRYADGVPALAVRPVGRGLVALWNFSPVRSFSNLAQLAQFPVLASSTLRWLTARRRPKTMAWWHQAVTTALPESMPLAMAAVRRPGEDIGQVVVLDAGRRSVTVPADQLGHWRLDFTRADRRAVAGFSVNARAAESDLSPIRPERVKAMFPAGRVVVASKADELIRRRRLIRRPLDLSPPLLLGLLVLMIGESFLANRFYRRAGGAAAGAPVTRISR